jgi:hypothetical protein
LVLDLKPKGLALAADCVALNQYPIQNNTRVMCLEMTDDNQTAQHDYALDDWRHVQESQHKQVDHGMNQGTCANGNTGAWG